MLPSNPYTKALLAARPQLGSMSGQAYPRRFPLISLHDPSLCRTANRAGTPWVEGEPILRVRNLVTRFPLRSGILNRVTREVHAVGKS